MVELKSPEMFETDFVDGAQFLILCSEYQEIYATNEIYTLRVFCDDGDYLRLGDDLQHHYKNWPNFYWGNTTTWVQIFPTTRLTEEEIFVIKIGGPEALFDDRIQIDVKESLWHSRQT